MRCSNLPLVLCKENNGRKDLHGHLPQLLSNGWTWHILAYFTLFYCPFLTFLIYNDIYIYISVCQGLTVNLVVCSASAPRNQSSSRNSCQINDSTLSNKCVDMPLVGSDGTRSILWFGMILMHVNIIYIDSSICFDMHQVQNVYCNRSYMII